MFWPRGWVQFRQNRLYRQAELHSLCPEMIFNATPRSFAVSIAGEHDARAHNLRDPRLLLGGERRAHAAMLSAGAAFAAHSFLRGGLVCINQFASIARSWLAASAMTDGQYSAGMRFRAPHARTFTGSVSHAAAIDTALSWPIRP